MIDPYQKCPTLESSNYIFRQVTVEDAQDLLACYSDKESVKLFNSDNCPMDFYFDDVDELKKLIEFWLMGYSYGGYVRFSIVEKVTNKAIGTIEIFAKKETNDVYGKVGTLRLDLCSRFENNEALEEIFVLIENSFGELFGIDAMMTKAVPYADARVKLLSGSGYVLLPDHTVTKFEDYYIKILGDSKVSTIRSNI